MVVGPVLAVLVGAVTSSIRDQVGASNIGIALAIIVVLAALCGRVAALTTAVAAALTFNFFHTQPYHSLRVHESRDVVIVALLAVLGLVVSDISSWMHRRETIDARLATANDAPRAVTEMLASPHPVGEVWPAVATTIIDQLGLADCSFEPGDHTKLPLISRVGASRAHTDDGFVLPSGGAALPVVSGTETLGHLVLRPRTGISSLWVERRVAVALADHVAIALTYTGHRTGRGSSPRADSSPLGHS